MNNCNNCNSELTGKYCSNCGQPAIAKRIDGHYILHEIEHVLHFEKGILFTVRELLIRPGANVREFIKTNRSRLVKPIIFVIITSLIYTLTSHFFHVQDGYVNFSSDENSTAGLISNWIQNHYGYSNIIMGVFVALWLKLFFWNYEYNLFEILILLCFVIGMGMLIFSVFAVLEGLSKLSLMKIGGMIAVFYFTWAIGQFFNPGKILSYLKSFASYVLGMITFSFSGLLIGQLIDFFIRH